MVYHCNFKLSDIAKFTGLNISTVREAYYQNPKILTDIDQFVYYCMARKCSNLMKETEESD